MGRQDSPPAWPQEAYRPRSPHFWTLMGGPPGPWPRPWPGGPQPWPRPWPRGAPQTLTWTLTRGPPGSWPGPWPGGPPDLDLDLDQGGPPDLDLDFDQGGSLDLDLDLDQGAPGPWPGGPSRPWPGPWLGGPRPWLGGPQTLTGGPPDLDSDLDLGGPPRTLTGGPPCGQTEILKTLPSLKLRLRAVKIACKQFHSGLADQFLGLSFCLVLSWSFWPSYVWDV